MLLTTKSASASFPFNISHLGLSGIFFLIINNDNIPTNPIVNNCLHLAVSPITMFNTAAKDPPKCQVPSIPMLTLPRYFGGKNSSIAVKMAVN